MKRTGLNSISLLFTVIMAGAFNTCLMAQSVPIGINYQAVARDASGNELINRSIDVRLSIISGSPAGEVEWEEVHSEVTTSQFGLFNIIIGQGIYSNGTVTSFEDIPWGDDLHFLKVEIKFDSEYLTMGTMQFLSVPYALYAQKSLEPGPQGPPGPAGDPASDDQVLSYDPQNYILYLENDDNPVDLSGLINDADADPDNELQILNLSGNKLQIKTLLDSTLINTVDIDASPINEIQDLHIEGNILYITRNSDSTRIDLSQYLDNTDEQDLSLIKNLLSIENGNSVALNYNDTSAVNEIQDLSLSNNTLTITNNPDGTDIDLSGYLDNTDQQNLNLEDNLLTIENGNTVALNYNDTSATNELISGGILDGTDLKITDAGGTKTVDLSSLGNIPLTGFKYRNDVGSGVITGPDTVDISFDIEELNFGDDFNGTEFTAPEDGVYSFYVTYDSNGDILRVTKNNQQVGYFFDQRSFSFILYLIAGNQVKLQFIQESGIGNYFPCTFTGFRIH